MAKGKTNPGDLVQHLTALRIRVTGEGNLNLIGWSTDSFVSQNFGSIAMAPATNVVPTKLTNFIQQKMQIEVNTTEINEWFSIFRITVFIKPIATSYPG